MNNKKKKNYDKSKRVINFWNNNYIEYERNGIRNRNISLNEYLNKINSYLRNIIIDLQSSDTSKIQLTIAINFISSKDTEEEHVMHSLNDNAKLTSYNDANEVVNELFESLRSRYQGNLETPMREIIIISDSVQLIYYKCHKVNFRRGGPNIDSEENKGNPERVTNIKPFINKYNWEGIN